MVKFNLKTLTTYLSLTNRGVEPEDTKVKGHFHGGRTVIMELVKLIEDCFKLVLCPEVVMVMPQRRTAWMDRRFKACHNAKVVTSSPHSPEQIGVTRLVNRNGGTVGQDNVQLKDIIADHAVSSFETSVTTTKARAQQTDAGAAPGSYSVLGTDHENLF